MQSLGPRAVYSKVGFKAGITRFKGPVTPYQISGYNISFQGIIVDTIDRLGTLPFNIDGPWYQWLTEATKLAGAIYSANSDPFEILWRTLISDHIRAKGKCIYPAPARYRTAFEQFYALYLNPILGGLSFEQATAYVENDSTIFAAHKQQAATFIESFWGKKINNRRFASTAKKTLALVHPNTKQGDLVCIFIGAEVPFVIRKKDFGSCSGNAEFELVGQCYVHGLMEGQGLQVGGIRRITLG